MLALVLLIQAEGFFPKRDVDFWGDHKKAPPAVSTESLFSETVILPDGKPARWTPPPEVLALLEQPTPENARRYLELQAERLKKIRKAMQAVQAAAAAGIRIEVYALPDCPACKRQKEELKDCPWPVQWLPASEEYDTYPTLVIHQGPRSKTLTGFQSLDTIRREVNRD
jgi:hypothetical protein